MPRKKLKAEKRESKKAKKNKMRVSGKSVFELKKIILKKSRYGSGN
jgi:hypothetical protein